MPPESRLFPFRTFPKLDRIRECLGWNAAVVTSRRSRCVVELPDFDDAFIEIVEQARIDAHLAKILAKRLPMSAAAAHWTMVNTDHVIAPDIGDGFTGYVNIGRRVISGAPGSSPTERAITIRHPSRQARQLYPHVAAVTASFDGHNVL
jgi:hypothetical protein